MSEQSEIMELLAKLMRHEQSAREIGSLAEAEAFASKVQKLLTEHKLEMSEIQFVQREQDEPIGQEVVSATTIGVKRRNKRVEWQEVLAYSIARCNGCQLLITQVSNTVFFVGRTSDRQICAALYARFVRMAFDLAGKSAKENYDSQREKCKIRSVHYYYSGAVFAHWMRAYRNSFCVGFSNSIQVRFVEQFREAEKRKEESDGAECSAMVHMKSDAVAVQSYIDELMKGRKESKAKPNMEYDDRNFSRDGYKLGTEAGNSAALVSHEISGAV